MLVLGRKRGERIVIGDDVEIQVLSVEGGRVKLGFEAPQDVTIMRRELLEREVPEAAGDR